VSRTERSVTRFREFLLGPVVVPASMGSFDWGFAPASQSKILAQDGSAILLASDN
jgi:hypothetical protein